MSFDEKLKFLYSKQKKDNSDDIEVISYRLAGRIHITTHLSEPGYLPMNASKDDEPVSIHTLAERSVELLDAELKPICTKTLDEQLRKTAERHSALCSGGTLIESVVTHAYERSTKRMPEYTLTEYAA